MFNQFKLEIYASNTRGIFDKYVYKTDDDIAEVMEPGYFAQNRFLLENPESWVKAVIDIYAKDKYTTLRVTDDGLSVIEVGGGSSFAIGPTPNEFRSATLAGAIALLDAQSTADPEWLAVYDAAPLLGSQNAALNVRVFYAVDGNQYLNLMARDNGNWVINEAFEGVVGDAGKNGIDGSGVTSSFDSIETLNEYYLEGDKFKSLTVDSSVSVSSKGVVFQYIWIGENLPQQYNPENWTKAEIGTTAGSLIMGPASIESAAETLMYKSATDKKNYIIQSFFDSSGSQKPVYPELSAEIPFDLALVDTDALAPPIKSEAVMSFPSVSSGFICKPASAGTMRYRTWIGTEASHEGEPILNEALTITPEMIGTEVILPIKNPVIINDGSPLYSEITGVSLFGGLQTEGPMTGQTVSFTKLLLQSLTNRTMALMDDAVKVAVDVDSENESSFLIDQLTPGDGVSLNIVGKGTHSTIEISSEGTGVGQIIDGKALGFNDSLGDLYATPQYSVDIDSGNTLRPFYYKANGDFTSKIEMGSAIAGYFQADPASQFTLSTNTNVTPDGLYLSKTKESSGLISYKLSDDQGAVISEINKVGISGGVESISIALPSEFQFVTGVNYTLDFEVLDGSISLGGDTATKSASVIAINYITANLEKVDLSTTDNTKPLLSYVTDNSLASITGTLNIFTSVAISEGSYKFECGSGFASPDYMRWGQMQLSVSGGPTVVTACTIESSGSAARNYANCSTTRFFDVPAGGATIDLYLNASAYSNLETRNVYAYLTKL